jgi:hypothetical protein
MTELSIFNHRQRFNEAWPFTYNGGMPAAAHDRQILEHSAFGKVAVYCSCGWCAVASYDDRPSEDAGAACLSAHKIHVIDV